MTLKTSIEKYKIIINKINTNKTKTNIIKYCTRTKENWILLYPNIEILLQNVLTNIVIILFLKS
jgi:hypothetical protein